MNGYINLLIMFVIYIIKSFLIFAGSHYFLKYNNYNNY